MTDFEIMEYISKKSKMVRYIGNVFFHTDLTWEKEDGIKTIVCVYCDNASGHEDEFVISSICCNRNTDVDFYKTHEKVYKKNTLTPELLDKIMYNHTIEESSYYVHPKSLINLSIECDEGVIFAVKEKEDHSKMDYGFLAKWFSFHFIYNYECIYLSTTNKS